MRNPNCLQTTAASLMSQESEQTRPHRPPKQISRVPLVGLVPLTSLIFVSLHTGAALERNELTLQLHLWFFTHLPTYIHTHTCTHTHTQTQTHTHKHTHTHTHTHTLTHTHIYTGMLTRAAFNQEEISAAGSIKKTVVVTRARFRWNRTTGTQAARIMTSTSTRCCRIQVK